MLFYHLFWLAYLTAYKKRYHWYWRNRWTCPLCVVNIWFFLCCIWRISEKRNTDERRRMSILGGDKFPFHQHSISCRAISKCLTNLSYFLFVWTLVLSSIAAICVMTVNILFLKNWYYLFDDVNPKDLVVPDKHRSRHKAGTESMDSFFDSI